jgi:hypothetical protein
MSKLALSPGVSAVPVACCPRLLGLPQPDASFDPAAAVEKRIAGPIEHQIQGGLDPSLDPNAPLRDETKRDERGGHLPLSS